MEIRKGPYGQFAILKTDKDAQVFEYAIEIMQNSIVPCLLPVYTSPHELAFDRTGLIPVSKLQDRGAHITSQRRKAFGDLLLSLLRMTDLLLPLSLLDLSPDNIYEDPEEHGLYLCYIPLQREIMPDDLTVKGIGGARIRDLLEQESFSDLTTPDEKQSMIYAVENNDPDMFRETCEGLGKPLPSKDSPLSDLMLPGLLCILSLFAFVTGLIPLSAIFALGGIVVTLRYIARAEHRAPNAAEEKRTTVLFDEGREPVITFMTLRSRGLIGDRELVKAIYTEEATIGSDRFLSDIFIDDDSLSPVQARIENINGTFFVTDLSVDSSTEINNTKLLPERRYEIKSGQVLRVGRFDLDIRIGF